MQIPHFLSLAESRRDARPSCAFLVFLLVGTALLFGVWQVSPFLSVITLLCVSVIFLSLHVRVGFFALISLGFFLGLTLDFSTFTWAKPLPFLAQLNAPLVEFLALAALVALSIAWLVNSAPVSARLFVDRLWGFRFYGVFIAIAFLSTLTVFDGLVYESMRYVVRVLCFAYLAFFWFPLIMIRNRKTLDMVVTIWSILGIAIALFGFSSLFLAPQASVIRLVPYGFFGFAPLLYNHNLLAEPLVALLPIVGAVALRKTGYARTGYLVGAWLVALAALLTLSRAAWLALIVQLVALCALLWQTHTKARVAVLARRLGIVALVFIPILGYMAYFLQTSIVSSSNSARYAASEVAWFYTLRHPVIGNGPGSYQKLLGDTYAYTLDFGDPLEAHGFIQKILVEEGFLGLSFFLLFLMAILVFLYDKQATVAEEDRPLAIAFFLMPLGMMVFELFNTSYFQSVFWLPLGVAVAGSMLLKRRSVY